ncbi:MAG: tetratricopeptide repeat protein, partial [Spirochaetales bacterium]|nr:tetratricopeptide repeat protein [Spirochaetales bacterium]
TYLKNGKFNEAKIFLNENLSENYESDLILFALKTVTKWDDNLKEVEKYHDYLDKGNFFLKKWDSYLSYFKIPVEFERCFFELKSWVFKKALENFQNFSSIYSGKDAHLLIQIAICYKGLENYKEALTFFEDAYRLDQANADIMAQMADCYALNNEIRFAKVFFREAFFIGAEKIVLERLESELIKRLIKKVEDEVEDKDIVNEWVPVYGKIWGIFSIKRELKPVELGKLKQAVYSLEHSDFQKNHFLRPRLLNHYFWLVDHYLSDKNNDFNRNHVNEILRKIKNLDPNIYNEFAK